MVTTGWRRLAVVALPLAALLWIRGPDASSSSGHASLATQVDRLFAAWDRPDSPGCAVAIAKNGRIVHERGYGVADLEHGAPITPESVFYVGSVSKQFTAMAVALLADSRKLGLDDDIRRYLPEMPRYARPITVRHLLHHTSGLREVGAILALAGRRPDEAFDNQDVLEIAARQRHLEFAPGEQFRYSNTGYALLATIVERAGGMPFAAFAEANIFAPLEMTDTHFHADVSRLIPDRAYAYRIDAEGAFSLDVPVNTRVGAGGLFTTVEGLFKWDESFYGARLGSPSLIRLVETPGRLAGGEPLEYAFGLFVRRNEGLRVVAHGGSLGGYRAQLTRFPERHFTVICLCNLGSIDAERLAMEIAGLYLGERFGSRAIAPAVLRPPLEPTADVDAGPAQMASRPLTDYTGSYLSEELLATYTIQAGGGSLVLSRRRAADAVLSCVGPDVFAAGTLRLTFSRSRDGLLNGFTLDGDDIAGIEFTKKQ